MSTSKKPAGFWKIFGASLLSGMAVWIAGIFILSIAISAILFHFSEQLEDRFAAETHKSIESNSVLRINLGSAIQERSYGELNTMSLSINSFLGLHDVCQMIDKAANDDRIEGIVLDVKNVRTGLATTEEIRNALLNFKSSGKFVYAYGSSFTQKSYYLASVADKVYMYPTGYFEFKGLSATITYYKTFLEKNNVEVQVIRGSNNRFKSAVEPFLEDEISPSNYEQTKRFLDRLWTVMLNDISASRNLTMDHLQNVADSLLVRNSSDAIDLGLVDDALFNDEFETLLPKKDDDVRYVSLQRYYKDYRKSPSYRRDNNFSNVAVIYAFGDIQSGKSKPGSIGDKTYVKAIKDADEDPMIKAIVLRINSPGGEALASDLIWDAVRKTDKPVVVSMGNVAASAGYMIACPARKIFSDRSTITGSIGVFMVVPNARELLEEDLGLRFSRVKTNPHADLSLLQLSLNTIARPLTDDEKALLQGGVDETYTDFVSKVVEGRKPLQDYASVDSIGQGRVWSGEDALMLGLTDTIGGLTDAIKYAGELVDLKTVRAGSYPKLSYDGIEKYIHLLNQGEATQFVHEKSALEEWMLKRIDALERLSVPGIQQARMFEDYTID